MPSSSSTLTSGHASVDSRLAVDCLQHPCDGRSTKTADDISSEIHLGKLVAWSSFSINVSVQETVVFTTRNTFIRYADPRRQTHIDI